MRPNTTERTVISGGATASSSFQISDKNSAHIMEVLREGLYSDKVLAVLREYGSNAWDAHRAAGKTDVPIKVTLPTTLACELSIRDYGPGLSPEEMFEIYTQYGESTKRNSDDYVGMLGIGSKSGFAYADTFSIVSMHGGMKRIYVAVIDETQKGRIDLFSEEECGDETGLEIRIPVRPHDIPTFHQRARGLFRFFDPQPTINVDLTPPKTTSRKIGKCIIDTTPNWDDRGKWHVLMGCVPYAVDFNQLVGVQEFTRNTSGMIFMDIGTVQISASREALKYSDFTKVALMNAFDQLAQDFLKETLDEVRKKETTNYQRYVLLKPMKAMGFACPPEYDFLLNAHNIELKVLSRKFKVSEGRTGRKGSSTGAALPTPGLDPPMYVQISSMIFVRDDDREIAGLYRKDRGMQTIVSPKAGHSVDDVVKQLEKAFAEAGWDGFPVGLTSEMEFSPPYKSSRAMGPNQKHKVKTFKFLVRRESPSSLNWEIVTRTALDKDVYVDIDRFEPEFNLYSVYKEDEKLLGMVKQGMPDVFGYKPKKRPSDPKPHGIEYRKWSAEKRKEVAKSPLIADKLRSSRSRSVQSKLKILSSSVDEVEQALGKDHELSRLLRVCEKAASEKIDYTERQEREWLESIMTNVVISDDPRVVYNNLITTYPLLPLMPEGYGVDTKTYPSWVQYIQAIDAMKGNP